MLNIILSLFPQDIGLNFKVALEVFHHLYHLFNFVVWEIRVVLLQLFKDNWLCLDLWHNFLKIVMHRIINHFFLILIFFLSLVVFLNFPLKSVERLNAFFLSLTSFFQVLLMFDICNFIQFLVLLFSSLFMESNFVVNIFFHFG